MGMFFTVAELIGTIAFAISGATLAIQKRLDIFGIILMGCTTALGGGMVRDILLGYTPPRVFYNGEYVALAALTSFIIFLVAKWQRKASFDNDPLYDFLLTFCDALGLGIFAVIGTKYSYFFGYGKNAFFCIFLGMMTGVGGGVLRDIMCMDIPFVLRKHIYAVAAILGSVLFYYMVYFGISEAVATLVGMSATLVLRMLAWHYRWNLPKVESI